MEPDTLHLYAYCANNPVNYVDPSGHASKWVHGRKQKTFGLMPVPDVGWMAWRVRVSLSVNYKKKKNGKKTILNMSFAALGDKHSNCGNGTCIFTGVKIYKGKKKWKTIDGTSNVVKKGPGQVVSSTTCVYTDKQIRKNYAVGKKKIRVKASFYFAPPQEAYGWGGGITTSVRF